MLAVVVRTFLAIVASLTLLTNSAVSAEPTFLGYGTDPQWSPSGRLIGAWRHDTLAIFDVAAMKEIKTLAVPQPKFFYWISEDTIALSYQGQTVGVKPTDRYATITRAILTLRGQYQQVLGDTILDSRNCLTHWRKLPNGQVGVFRVENGTRTKFYTLLAGSLTEHAPDTTEQAKCWAKAPFGVTAYYPAHNCALAVVFTSDEFVDVLNADGARTFRVAPRAQVLPDGKYLVTGKPAWSQSGRYVSFRQVIEDGHYQYKFTLLVFDVATGDIEELAEVDGNETIESEWSPTADRLIHSNRSDGRLVLCQLEQN